jgi:hypothetical protein
MPPELAGHPEIAAHLDPNNPMQRELLTRVGRLQPQETQALISGMSPGAMAVLKKIIPEIGFLLDAATKNAQPGALPPSGPQMPPRPAGGAPPTPPQGQPPQPSGLRRIA